MRWSPYGATGADGGYGSATSPVSTTTWTYDDAGNREIQVEGSGTTSYTANDVNQYTAVGAATPSYSSRGDLAGLGDWTYTYDAYGNLIKAYNSSTTVESKYWTDAFGARAVKDVGGSKTLYFNAGLNQLEAYVVSGSAASSTIYEPGVDRPLAEVDNSGNLTFYHQDWLGNVVLLTDGSGNVVEKYSYDAWGKVTATDASNVPVSVSAIASRFLYTGREYDKETGLYYYRARAYVPDLGRFLQNDPIDFRGGDSNLVRYVANNSINYVDPDGRWAHIAIAAGLGGLVNGGINAYHGGSFTKGFVAGAVGSGVAAATFNPAMGLAAAAGLEGLGAAVVSGAVSAGVGSLANSATAAGLGDCPQDVLSSLGISMLTGGVLGPLGAAANMYPMGTPVGNLSNVGTITMTVTETALATIPNNQ